MSKELTNSVFDYSQLSDDDAAKLKCFEGELLGSRKRVSHEVLMHGEILSRAQDAMANYTEGVFVAWLESGQVGMSSRSAYRAIAAFKDFGGFANVANLEVSAMYKLASSEPAKKKAKKLADKGVKVTNSMAKDLIESTKPKPEPDPIVPDPQPNSSEATDEPISEEEAEAYADSMEAEELESGSWDKSQDYEEDDESGEPFELDDVIEPAVPAPKPKRTPAEELKLQRAKTVKTIEAAMREFDELQSLKPNELHGGALGACKRALTIAREWK